MSDKTNLKRRQFLLGVGVSGAGAAAALIGARATAPAAPQAEAGGEDKRSSGYRLSEHVANYYRTARI